MRNRRTALTRGGGRPPQPQIGGNFLSEQEDINSRLLAGQNRNLSSMNLGQANRQNTNTQGSDQDNDGFGANFVPPFAQQDQGATQNSLGRQRTGGMINRRNNLTPNQFESNYAPQGALQLQHQNSDAGGKFGSLLGQNFGEQRAFGQTFQEPMRSNRLRQNPSGASLHDSVYSGQNNNNQLLTRPSINSNPGTFGGFGGHRQTMARGSMRNQSFAQKAGASRGSNFERTQQMPSEDPMFSQIMMQLAMYMAQQNLQAPIKYLAPYDLCQMRHYEEWELQIIFDLSPENASMLSQNLDKDQKGSISIRELAENLSKYNQKISSNQLPLKSMYQPRFPKMTQDIMRWIINKMFEEFSPLENTYKEIFLNIQTRINPNEQPSLSSEMDTNQFKEQVLLSIEMSYEFEELTADEVLSEMVKYICIGSTFSMNVIQFRRALNSLLPDKTMAQSSQHELSQATNLDDILAQVPEKQAEKVYEPALVKVARCLKHRQMLSESELRDQFTKIEKKRVVDILKRSLETETVSLTDFEEFLFGLRVGMDKTASHKDQMGVSGYPLLNQAEVDKICSMFKVETKEQTLMQGGLPAMPEAANEEEEEEQKKATPNTSQLPGSSEQQKELEKSEKPDVKNLKLNQESEPDMAADKKEDASKELNKITDEFDDDINDRALPNKDSDPKLAPSDKSGPTDHGKQTQEKTAANSLPPLELKEGGQTETEVSLIDFSNFVKEVIEAAEADKLGREEMKTIIIEVFEQIKKFLVVTGKSLSLLFVKYDKKGTKKLKQEQIRRIFNLLMSPHKLTENHMVAISFIMGKEQDSTDVRLALNYETFKNVFFTYANRSQVFDATNQLFPCLEAIEEYRERQRVKSLALWLLSNPEKQFQQDVNYKLEVQHTKFLNKLNPVLNQVRGINKMSALKQLDEHCLVHQQSSENTIDLVKLQELIGFKQVQVMSISGNVWRKLAQKIQISMMTLRELKTALKSSKLNKVSKEDLAYRIADRFEGFRDDEIYAMLQEFSEGQFEVNISHFLGKIERELNRTRALQNFYVKVYKENPLGYDDFLENIQGDDENTMHTSAFKQLLIDKEVITAENDEIWKYFEEEYDTDQLGSVDKEQIYQDSEDFNNMFLLFEREIFGFCQEFCSRSRTNFKEQLQKVQKKNIPEQFQETTRKQSKLDTKSGLMWLHQFDFQIWFQEQVLRKIMHSQSGSCNLDILNIFTDIFCIEAREDYKQFMFMPDLLQRYYEEVQQGGVDPVIRSELYQERIPELVETIAGVLYRVERAFLDFFKTERVTLDQMVQILTDRPFKSAFEKLNFDLDTLYAVCEFLLTDREHIYLSALEQKVQTKIERMQQRKQLFLDLHRNLDKKMVGIEEALTQCSETRDVDTNGCTQREFVTLITTLSDSGRANGQFTLEDKEQFAQVWELFPKNIYYEVPNHEIMKYYNSVQLRQSPRKDRDDLGDSEAEITPEHFESISQDAKAIQQARRYFATVNEAINEMCADIEDRNLTDFGSFLKGYDLKETNQISRFAFYQIVTRIFDELMGQGDVMDIMNYFDQSYSGHIDLLFLQSDLNSRIFKQGCQIQLISKINDIIQESIVEKLEPVDKNSLKAKAGVNSSMPEIYVKRLSLDLHCGALLQVNSDFFAWFSQFSALTPNSLTSSEFERALQRLEVQGSLREIEEVYIYLLTKAAISQGKVASLKLLPIQQQSIDIEQICKTIKSDLPAHNLVDLNQRVIKLVAENLTKHKLPVVDTFRFYEAEPGTSLLTSQNFTKLFIEGFQLEDVLTPNMIALMEYRYNPFKSPTFDFNQFLADLDEFEHMSRTTVRIFKTQAEINFFNQEAGEGGDDSLLLGNQVTVEPQPEPVYTSRTKMNTYFQPKDNTAKAATITGGGLLTVSHMGDSMNQSMSQLNKTDQDLSHVHIDEIYKGRLNDIILHTRQNGACIEAFFQRFAKVNPQTGIRVLNTEQFSEAIQHLPKMSWHSDQFQAVELFEAICNAVNQKSMTLQTLNQSNGSFLDHDMNDRMNSTTLRTSKLNLNQLGQIFYFNASTDCDKFEAEVLQELHTDLGKHKMLSKLIDIIIFCNFSRDGTCTVKEVKRVIFDRMEMDGVVVEDRLEILLQRYRADEYIASRKQRQELKSGNFYAVQRAGANTSEQRIQIYQLMQDLAYQQRRVGLKEQWAAKIGEDLLKALQVKLAKDGAILMRNSDTASQIHNFCKNIIYSPTVFTYQDFGFLCTSLGLWENQLHLRQKLEDFYRFCSVESLLRQDEFQPNSIEMDSVILPAQMQLAQFVGAFEFLTRKSLEAVYQQVIDTFFIATKRLNFSITGPVISHLFDKTDPNQTGFVSIQEFAHVIDEFLRNSVGQNVEIPSIPVQDLEFLGTKYVKHGAEQIGMEPKKGPACEYALFINDYDSIEKLGLGAGADAQQLAETNFVKDTTLQKTSGSLRPKTREEIPLESRTIYEKMGAFCVKKNIDELLCTNLVNEDVARDACLPRNKIVDVMRRLGMTLNNKQVGLLLQVISLNSQNEYCYLEMIALLFTESFMWKIMQENGIEYGRKQVTTGLGGERQIDITQVQISTELKDQFELKFAFLNGKVSSLTRGSSLIRDQELFAMVTRDAQIVLNQNDIISLEKYMSFYRDTQNHTINFRVMMEHFEIRSEPSVLLQEIQKTLIQQQINFNELTVQKRLSLEDFRMVLERHKVSLHGREDKFEYLFMLMSNRESYLSKYQFVQILSMENMDLAAGTQKSGELPKAPMAAANFINHLVDNKFDIKSRFREQVKTKRISENQLRTFMKEIRYVPKTGDFQLIVEFFKARPLKQKENQPLNNTRSSLRVGRQEEFNVDFAKIFVYCKQKDSEYGQKKRQPTETDFASKASTFPRQMQKVLEKVAEYMRQQKLTREYLFEVLDKNCNGSVDLDEFKQFFAMTPQIQGVSQEDIEKLFSYLDTNGNNTLSVNEFCSFVIGVQLTKEERLKSFSYKFEAKLVSEIEALFERMDVDRSQSLTADELYETIRPQDCQGQFTMDGARNVIQHLDKDGDGRISKQEFTQFVLEKQKELILDFEDDMEDLRQQFIQQLKADDRKDDSDQFGAIESEKDGALESQYLTQAGLKRLIVSSGHTQVTDAEVDILFSEIDENGNGKIDIDEFMAFVQVAHKIDPRGGSEAKDAAFSIRKARLKLNEADLFEMFYKIPASLLPSFSQNQLEINRQNLPSSLLKPQLEQYSLRYKNFDALQKLTQQNTDVKLIAAEYKPTFAFEVSLSGLTIGVPLLKKLKHGDSVPHVEYRMVLFDTKSKTYASNFYILGAQITNETQAEGDKQTQISASIQPDSTMGSLYIKTNSQSQDLALVIEIVGYGEANRGKNKHQAQKQNQVTLAWTGIPLAQLAAGKSPPVTQTSEKTQISSNAIFKDGKVRLDLIGGNPFQPQQLRTKEDIEMEESAKKSEEQSKKNFFGKIFAGKKATKIDRCLQISVKQFSKMSQTTRLELCILPQSSLVPKSLLNFVFAYFVHHQRIFASNTASQLKPQPDLVVKQLPKMWDNPDLLSGLCQSWSLLHPAADDTPTGNKKVHSVVSEVRVSDMLDMTRCLYAVKFDANMRLEQRIQTCRTSNQSDWLYRHRMITIKRSLVAAKLTAPKQKEAFLQESKQCLEEVKKAQTEPSSASASKPFQFSKEGETLFLEDYVPFGVAEIGGTNFGLNQDDADFYGNSGQSQNELRNAQMQQRYEKV